MASVAGGISTTQLLRLSHPANYRQVLALGHTAVRATKISAPAPHSSKSCQSSGRRHGIQKSPPRASPYGSSSASDDGEDGILLGTLKLSPNTDLAMFEALLFQWANSLYQGANVPLPVPLKVDKVKGGVRLGFSRIGAGGGIEVPVYVDCLVFPAEGPGTSPIFRAIRNGPLKEQPPPGEPRIMRSLLAALQKSVEIARV